MMSSAAALLEAARESPLGILPGIHYAVVRMLSAHSGKTYMGVRAALRTLCKSPSCPLRAEHRLCRRLANMEIALKVLPHVTHQWGQNLLEDLAANIQNRYVGHVVSQT